MGPIAWFQKGLDLRLPQDEQHSCGVFCGVPHAKRKDIGPKILGEFSPWAQREQKRERLLRRRRPIQFFWSGFASGSNKGFRGGLMRYHLNRSRWLLRDTKVLASLARAQRQ